ALKAKAGVRPALTVLPSTPRWLWNPALLLAFQREISAGFPAPLAPPTASPALPGETSPRAWPAECSHPPPPDQFPKTGSTPGNALSSAPCDTAPAAQYLAPDSPPAAGSQTNAGPRAWSVKHPARP